jgi:osmoprotectant transport system substrate-binding protein
LYRAFRVAIPFVVAALVASACGGASTGPKPTVKIGSFNFAESILLGELYAQALEANGYTIERKFNLGNRAIVFPALDKGDVDVVPEYLATVLRFVDTNAKGSSDPKEAQKQLQDAVKSKNLTVLDYAQAVDENAFVVTKATADKYKLKKTSDIAANAQGQLVLGGPPECPQRPFCRIGLEGTYGIKLKDFKPLDAGGPLTVAALDGNQIDVALLFSSDAIIAVKGYVVLEDDKHLQLADNVAPLVRNAVATDDLKKVLNAISAKLTTDELIALNRANGVDKKDANVVAKDWLKKQGLIK